MANQTHFWLAIMSEQFFSVILYSDLVAYIGSIYHPVSFIIGTTSAALPFGYIGTQTNSVAYEISHIGGIQISNAVVSVIWNW